MRIFKLRTEYDVQNFAIHILTSITAPCLANLIAGYAGQSYGHLALRLTCVVLIVMWVLKELVTDGHLHRILLHEQTSEWWLDLWTDWFSQLTPLILFLIFVH